MSVMTDNELIAEFMGFKPINFTPIDKQAVYKILDAKGNHIHPYYGPHRSEQMQFNSSWDWLMPVVERIKPINGGTSFNNVFKALETVKIELIYEAVIKFIKWYNEQKKS